MTTQESRARLRVLADKATPGPWTVHESAIGSIEAAGGLAIAQAQQNTPVRSRADLAERLANTEYIAAANPATVLALLSALDAAELVIAEAREALTQLDAEGEGGYNNEGLADSLAAYDAATTAKDAT